MSVTIVPIFQREAFEFIRSFHRHNKPPVGAMLVVGASDGERLVGVAVVGRPTARGWQDGATCEVTRCCVLDDAPKGTPSALYAACWRAAKALGWQRLITYTLQTEGGDSLRGAGWKLIAERTARDPKQWQSRVGREWQAVTGQAKFVWSP